MTTFSLKVPSPAIVAEYKAILEKIKDEIPEIKSQSDAIALVFKTFTEGFDALTPSKEPKSVEALLNEINCPHLKFEDLDFKCFERFEKRKQPDALSSDQDKIRTRCEACKQRKAEAIIEQYQRKLRGHNIRGLLAMIKTLETFAEKGIPSTIYFCNRIRGRQVMTGKKKIHCSKVNFELVPIDPACTDPVCKYFQKFTVKVEHEFPRETLALIEGIADDYKRIEDLTQSPKKEVDADQAPEGEEET